MTGSNRHLSMSLVAGAMMLGGGVHQSYKTRTGAPYDSKPLSNRERKLQEKNARKRAKEKKS